MAIFFGFLAVVVWLLVTFVLPVVAFLRASRAASDAATLRLGSPPSKPTSAI